MRKKIVNIEEKKIRDELREKHREKLEKKFKKGEKSVNVVCERPLPC